ncbi:hypothetical protein EJB05_24963, partial [Eragrostis curvula]
MLHTLQRSSTKIPQLPRATVPFYTKKYTKHTAAIVLLSLLFLGCFVSQAPCRGMNDLGDDEKISVASPKCWKNRAEISAMQLRMKAGRAMAARPTAAKQMRLNASNSPNAKHEV